MDVGRRSLALRQSPSLVKQRGGTVLAKMTVVGNAFLLAMQRVLAGIQINDEPPPVLPS